MIIFCVLLSVCSVFVFADTGGFEDEINTLIEEGEFQTAINKLESNLNSLSNKQKSVACHLLSSLYLFLGDTYVDSEESQNKILETFDIGVEYGTKAVSYDKNNYLGYYWKASNIGKWAQVKGIFDSLFKAGDMKDNLHKALKINPDHSLSYYVLGMMYEQVPGFPVSFGNVDFSVSLGRKSVETMEKELKKGEREKINLDYYVQLAKHLYIRNWNAGHRRGQMKHKEGEYGRKHDVLEKAFFFEGAIDIPNTSDREEAIELVQYVVDEIKKDPEKGDENFEKEAKELLQAWTK